MVTASNVSGCEVHLQLLQPYEGTHHTPEQVSFVGGMEKRQPQQLQDEPGTPEDDDDVVVAAASSVVAAVMRETKKMTTTTERIQEG